MSRKKRKPAKIVGFIDPWNNGIETRQNKRLDAKDLVEAAQLERIARSDAVKRAAGSPVLLGDLPTMRTIYGRALAKRRWDKKAGKA